jgi:hypothetical protein
MKTKTLYIAFDGRTFEAAIQARTYEKRLLLAMLLAEQLKAMFVASETSDRVRAEPAQLAAHLGDILANTILSHATLAWIPGEAVRLHLHQLARELGAGTDHVHSLLED